MTDNMNFNGEVINGDCCDIQDNICRDFLRYTCKRGNMCRYKHPEGYEAEASGKKDVVFCHDFQNKECQRPNCKFVHCTKQEEEIFRSTGRLPDTVVKTLNSNNPVNSPNAPVCKDYLKNECRRAGHCKFKHMPHHTYQVDNNCAGSHCNHYNDYEEYEPLAKRRSIEAFYEMPPHHNGLRRPVLSPHYQILRDENAMLLHKIEELKKQVADLTATNEFLLDQNAQLRVSKQTLVSPISQQLIPHTLTPTIPSLPPQSITQLSTIPLNTDLGAASLPNLGLTQGIAPASIAPSQVALPTISAAPLSQSLPQTIITSTALISYPIMTQSMRPVIQHSMG